MALHGGMLTAVLRAIVCARPPINDHGTLFELGYAGQARCSHDPRGHWWMLQELRR